MLPVRKIVGDNVRLWAAERGLTLDGLAVRSGVSRRVLGKVTAARENYRMDILESIARGLRIAPWQLLADQETVRQVKEDDHVPYGFTRVPRLNVEASAGHGAMSVDSVIALQQIEMPETWLRQVLGAHNSESLRIIDARGDSMSPSINHGDILFVDIEQNVFDGEGIYTLVWHDQLFVKRLRIAAGGRISIHSDNAAYPPEYVGADAADQLTICGRVVGWWTLRRY